MRIMPVIVGSRPHHFRGLRKYILSLQQAEAAFLIGRQRFLMLSMIQRPRFSVLWLFHPLGFQSHLPNKKKNGEEGRPVP